MVMVGTESGKANEVYSRMCHPQWGIMRDFGFELDESIADQPVWMETWRSKIAPAITVDVKLRQAMINDPIAALVYSGGEKINIAYNAAGLRNVLANAFDKDHNCAPVEDSVVETDNGWERRQGVCQTCGPDGRRVVSEKFEDDEGWSAFSHG